MRLNLTRVAVAALALGLLAGCGDRISAGEALRAQQAANPTATQSLEELPQQQAPVESTTDAAQPETSAATEAAPVAGTAVAAPEARTRSKTSTTTGAPAERKSAAAATAPTSGTTTCTPGLPPIRIGQIGHFSGIAGPLVAPARTGLATWVKDVNARGGLACRQIQLFVVDDGTEASRTAALVGQLVTEKKVIALVGAFSPLTSASLAQAAAKHKVPVVGGDVASFEWNTSPWMFGQGGGLRTRPYGATRQAVENGLTKMALLYCVENPSCTTLAQVLEKEKIVEKAGGSIVYSSPVSLVAPDYTAQCQNAKNAGAQVMGVAMDGASINRMLRSCDSIGFRPPVVTDSMLISAGNAQDPIMRRNGVYSVNITAPWMLEDTAGQRAYRAAMNKYAPSAPLDSGSILAWTAGKLFEKAFAPDDSTTPTAARVYAALGKIDGETLGGLTPPLTFRAGKPAPEVQCLYYTRLDEKGWSAPKGSKAQCRPK